jgi:hypothetical protein
MAPVNSAVSGEREAGKRRGGEGGGEESGTAKLSAGAKPPFHELFVEVEGLWGVAPIYVCSFIVIITK